MNIKIRAKAYRSQCGGFNLCFTSVIKLKDSCNIKDLFRTRRGRVSLYINIQNEVGLFGVSEFGLNAANR